MQGPPKKILLATDLSARCDRALDRAVSLAAAWKAQIVAVHVMESDTVRVMNGADPVPSWRRPPDPKKLAEGRIRSEIRELSPDFLVAIETGDPAEAIMRTAQTQGCDLILTGVARDEPLGRFVVGSTVDRLVRRSSVPVLVVRKRGQRPYRYVVVATDFSEPSRHALEAAVRFFPSQRLTIFNAFDAPMSAFAGDPEAHRQQFRDAAAKAGEVYLEHSDLSGWQGGKPQVLLECGEPDQLLHDYAQEKDVDVVTVGSHGRSALFQVLIGSVARRLISTLPCDVLVVREPRAVAAA
jgi:nucleotide-binding universal stress UspA family protein